MSTIVFDTLKLSQKLTNAGFTREQADGAANALAESFGDEVVTKGYLDMRLKELEERTNIRLMGLKAEILKWMFGALFAQAALIATLVKLL